MIESCVALGYGSSRILPSSISTSQPLASSRVMVPPVGSQQPAQRAEVEVEVFVVEPERVLQLVHAGFERHQRAAQALDRLVVETTGLDAAERLAFHQLAQQLDERQNERGEPA